MKYFLKNISKTSKHAFYSMTPVVKGETQIVHSKINFVSGPQPLDKKERKNGLPQSTSIRNVSKLRSANLRLAGLRNLRVQAERSARDDGSLRYLQQKYSLQSHNGAPTL